MKSDAATSADAPLWEHDAPYVAPRPPHMRDDLTDWVDVGCPVPPEPDAALSRGRIG